VSTQAQVGGLQTQLTEMEPILIRTQADVEALIVQITKDSTEAARTKLEVQVRFLSAFTRS
jgi:dynein heavy chain, axonemal